MEKLPNTKIEEKSEFEQRLSKFYQGEEYLFEEGGDKKAESVVEEDSRDLSVEESASVFDTILSGEAEEEPVPVESVVIQETEEPDDLDLEIEEFQKVEEQRYQEEEAEKFEKNSITFTLFFSADKMIAYIRAQDYKKGKNENNRIPTDIIYDLLIEKDVKYGIDDSGIVEYCKGRSFYKDFQVAQGKRAVRGIDGSAEFFFATNLGYEPQERDDGTVDYKELGLIRNVSGGDVLCRITPPTEGTEGIDVLGGIVKPTAGTPAVVSSGRGVEVSEDGLEFTAINSGMVELNGGVVEVKEIYTIQGDVGPATGNIRFNGAVTVMGSVLSDYSVFANGDIIVNGYVEASILNSTGNILINNGINGMKKGFLKADGNVTVKFAEMARVVAGGNFYCDYCINCDVRAGEAIIGKGKRASFLGGNYIAGKTIEANTFGSGLNIPMEIQIIPQWQNIRNLKIKPDERIRENNEILSEYNKQFSKIKTSLDFVENEIAKLSRKNKLDSRDEINAKKKKVVNLMQQKFSIKNELEEIEEKISKITAVNECEGCMVIARKIAHTSVRIVIGNAMLRINGHIEKVTFAENEGSIETYHITPGSS